MLRSELRNNDSRGIAFLKHDNYRWGSEWEPVDTDELLDISSADLENLLETEDANYNRQKVFSNLHN